MNSVSEVIDVLNFVAPTKEVFVRECKFLMCHDSVCRDLKKGCLFGDLHLHEVLFAFFFSSKKMHFLKPCNASFLQGYCKFDLSFSTTLMHMHRGDFKAYQSYHLNFYKEI